MLVREWGVTVLRFFVIRHGVMPAGRGGKVKTALQFFGLLLFTLPLASFSGADTWTTRGRRHRWASRSSSPS